MLAYLDALCTALRLRDLARIAELLCHPLASALPASVVDEARRIAGADPSDVAAPVQTLRLYHQTAHLLGVCADPASRVHAARSAPSGQANERQIEIEFPAPRRMLTVAGAVGAVVGA